MVTSEIGRATRTLRWLFAILLVSVTSFAHSRAPETIFLEDLTWTELDEQIRTGKTTIIIPIGGTEQNGPAIVLGKHNVRAKSLAQRIATVLGNALVAPVIAYVPEGALNLPTQHMRFPGTITVPEDAFQKTLEYAARSFKLHGFRHIVLLGDHGGYQNNLKTVARSLNREWSTAPARVHAIDEYYRAATTGYARALKLRGYPDDEIGTHAGLADTSLTLALAPAQVRAERLSTENRLGVAHGVHGDPRRASGELGDAGVHLIISRTVEAIKKAIADR
jgi:creatinine amidohydrolase/Fe(II)-dependent formamide hydrolase-like protein